MEHCKAIVGVSGGSGSGKTTFCRELVSKLGQHLVLHITQDSYYRDLSHLSQEARDRVNFDHPQAIDFELLCEHLKLLKDGNSVNVPRYDFASHTRSPTFRLEEPKPILVIEGILIFSQDNIFEHINHSVFVDTPEHVRLSRRIRRDIAERGRSRESVENQFFSTVAPMHDLFVEPCKHKSLSVISGEQPFAPIIEDLTQHLKTMLSR